MVCLDLLKKFMDSAFFPDVLRFVVHESQIQALYSHINGKDIFLNLPTGYGKSLIFERGGLPFMRGCMKM